MTKLTQTTLSTELDPSAYGMLVQNTDDFSNYQTKDRLHKQNWDKRVVIWKRIKVDSHFTLYLRLCSQLIGELNVMKEIHVHVLDEK